MIEDDDVQEMEGVEEEKPNESVSKDSPLCLTLRKNSSVYFGDEECPVLEATVYDATLFANKDEKETPLSRKPSSSGGSNDNNQNANDLLGWINWFTGVGATAENSENKNQSKPQTQTHNILFKDCGGLEKQIQFIQSAIIEPLKNEKSKLFSRFGLQPSKGILFYGAPGTGKTRLAQALGNELKELLGINVHFIYRKGNDMASKFFGQSEENLRKIFNEAKARKPTVLFFDEIDGLCPNRDKAHISEANVSVVTAILGLMDNIPQGEVFIIGATNRLEAIDPALRRPGRFDKHLEFLPPSAQGRLDILKIHTSIWKIPPEENVLTNMCRQTVGFTGADLAKLCQDAFDRALDRTLEEDLDLGNIDNQLEGLSVGVEDWKSALTHVKPSKSVFGSAVYTPPEWVGDHILPLVEPYAKFIEMGITKLLGSPHPHSFGAGIKAFYVWSNLENHINDLIMPVTIRSKEINKYPMFCLNGDTLFETNSHEWAKKVDETFSQALNSPQHSILFLQSVDKLVDLIAEGKLELAMNLSQQLERLRGMPVILLATGSTHPNEFKDNHPLRNAFTGIDTTYEVLPPLRDDTEQFFRQLFESIQAEGGDEILWSDEHMDELLEVAVDATEDVEKPGLDAILGLYHAFEYALDSNPVGDDTDTVKLFLQVLATYNLEEISQR